MAKAIDETNRRRAKQVAYNEANGIDPTPLRKRISDITELLAREDADTEELIGGAGRQQSRGKAPVPGLSSRAGAGAHAAELGGLPAADLADLIQQLTDQMHAAAGELQFELAARLRDEIGELKKELRGMRAAGSI
jgi:excinuclease ABC subunit B